MEQKVIIVEEGQEVYEAEIDESEIPSLLDGGFVIAILRSVEEGIEYAEINYNNKEVDNIISTVPEVEWKVPHKKDE